MSTTHDNGDHDGSGAVASSLRAVALRRLLLFLLLGFIGIVVLSLALAVTVASPWLKGLGGFYEESTDIVRSPGGGWSLATHSISNGALGGSTDVLLRPERGGPSYVLYDGDWMNVSDVAWLDARTVRLGYKLQMPFVRCAIDTGSAATSGSDLDALGYVRNVIPSGDRVTLLSGLSVVLPGGRAGRLLSRRTPAKHDPWQKLTPVRADTRERSWRYGVVTLRRAKEFAHWGAVKHGRLVARSKDRGVEVRWLPAARSIFVLVAGYETIGVVWEREVTVSSAGEAYARAAQMWRDLSVRGARLPRRGE